MRLLRANFCEMDPEVPPQQRIEGCLPFGKYRPKMPVRQIKSWILSFPYRSPFCVDIHVVVTVILGSYGIGSGHLFFFEKGILPGTKGDPFRITARDALTEDGLSGVLNVPLMRKRLLS